MAIKISLGLQLSVNIDTIHQSSSPGHAYGDQYLKHLVSGTHISESSPSVSVTIDCFAAEVKSGLIGQAVCQNSSNFLFSKFQEIFCEYLSSIEILFAFTFLNASLPGSSYSSQARITIGQVVAET